MTTVGMTGPCSVCGLPHVSCGPGMPVIAIDTPTGPSRQAYTMADLKEYRYVVNGIPTTAMLSEHDAELLGAVPVDSEPAPTRDVHAKARTHVPNMSRHPANKER